jgi:prevent-host-death family protein
MISFVYIEEIAISKFKATCLSVMERVRKTRQPVLVTRFGEPVAEIVPPSLPPRPEGWLGCMADTAEIVGDLVSPAGDPEDWEAVGP